MSRFKEDMDDAKERLKAWWDHEIIDRPCISYWTPRLGAKIPDTEDILEFFDPFYLAQFWDDLDTAIDMYETTAKIFNFGGENIPDFRPYYGPGIMSAVFGIEPKPQSRTVWFHKETSVDDIVPLLESVQINMNNPWYARLIKTTEIAAKRAGKDYSVGVTDLGGVLDILSSFLGPTKLILTMKRNPELIDTCRAIILEKWMKVFNDLQNIIQYHSDGISNWMYLWCHKPCYPIQCDFSAFLSPKWFKRFTLPDIISQAEQLDYCIYHLDGPDALKHLDDILSVPSITGIQWVPGAGKELNSDDHWIPIYKKIQAAKKNLVIDFFALPEQLAYFYKELEPKGFITTTIFMDNARTKFYLPRFIGGEGGEGSFREFKKIYRKKLKEQKL